MTYQSKPWSEPAKLPPTNLFAEQSLLGAILANNKAFDRVSDFLQPEHFADPINGRIYQAIRDRVSRNQLADAVTLKGDFENAGILEEVGGTQYLGQLLAAMVGIINAGDYGRAIHEAWMRREMLEASQDLADGALVQREGQTARDLLDAHEARMLKIAQGAGDRAAPVTAGAAMRRAYQNTIAAMTRGSGIAGITSGYASLDRTLSGLQREQLILIGARPSIGKTSIGLGIAARAARAGAKTLFWTGEMAADQLGSRMAAARTGLSTSSIFSGHNWPQPDDNDTAPRPLSEADLRRYRHAMAEAEKLPLVFEASSNMTVANLRAIARRAKMSGGLDLLVVDYVGLLRASPEAQRRGQYERMTEISADLMALKAELKIPLIALTQLNRASENREDKTPQLSDLRDTGALEQDANVVLLLHREHFYLKKNPPQRKVGESDADLASRIQDWQQRLAETDGKGIVQIAKNRNGPTGVVEMQFHDETTWFRDINEVGHSDAW